MLFRFSCRHYDAAAATIRRCCRQRLRATATRGAALALWLLLMRYALLMPALRGAIRVAPIARHGTFARMLLRHTPHVVYQSHNMVLRHHHQNRHIGTANNSDDAVTGIRMAKSSAARRVLWHYRPPLAGNRPPSRAAAMILLLPLLMPCRRRC